MRPKSPNPKQIRIIGVGGGGIAILNRIADEKLANVELIAIDTSNEGLLAAKTEKHILISEHGLGTGGDPKIGESTAHENINYLQMTLSGADKAFLTGGLGGGTASGALPVIAQVTKKLNIPTLSVVTLPFTLEGMHRQNIAQTGVIELEKWGKELIVVNNEDLLDFVQHDDLTLSKLFSLASCMVTWKILSQLI
jgi:cell division protein FtsZ